MTPAEEAGLKVGDKIRALEENEYITKGEIIELKEDDGSSCPWFWEEDKSDWRAFDIVTRKWEKVA